MASAHRQQQMSRVEYWNSIKPDPHYIPGLGRGAQGFTTRSDIGPSKFTPTIQGGNAEEPKKDATDEDAAANQPFDHFMGNDTGAFAYGDYDQDDKEADETYAKIEELMGERRKVQREKREQEEFSAFRKENPLIKEQFEDVKRELAKVTEEEWKAIPEIGDYTVKRRKRFETFSAVSDSLLADALAGATGNTGNVEQVSGFSTDLTALGSGKKQMLGVSLDRMADSVSGQTTVDPTGYLTSLASKKVSSAAEVSDIKRARMLMKSMVNTNPKSPHAWIAYARLEEIAGELKTARSIIAQGTEACPQNEDVWLEAARLQTPENARSMLARGVQQLPNSIKLWMQAARVEHDDAAKRRVLRKALERNSKSVRLWKAAVELHDEDEARLLLSRAVECCPDQVDLWIALVRLEPDFKRAKQALNAAAKALPTEPLLYITGAKLQEAHGDVKLVPKIINSAIKKKLPESGVIIDRETWLKEAETCEKASPPMLHTCRAIVNAVVDTAVDERERKDTYHRDAVECIQRGSFETARAILQHALAVFPESERTWRAMADLEKNHGTSESLQQVLGDAVAACPQSIVLWLMCAKEQWLAGDVQNARAVLERAHSKNPDSEEVILAAFKLEFENNEPERARLLAQRAKESLSDPSARVWQKAAMVARELNHVQEERQVLQEGIERFPDAPKLHMMLGQLEERDKNAAAARKALQMGLKRNPKCVPMWIMLARLEEKQGSVPAARAILEQGRLRNPKNAELWQAAVRTEVRAGNSAAASATLTRGVQDCEGAQNVGKLWALYIGMAQRTQRKARMQDAVKKADDDPHVFAAVGCVFLADRKYDKARKFFQRATVLNSDIGDFWGIWISCEEAAKQSPDAAANVMAAAKKADPHHGERWTQLRKRPENAHKPFEEVMRLLVRDFQERPDHEL